MAPGQTQPFEGIHDHNRKVKMNLPDSPIPWIQYVQAKQVSIARANPWFHCKWGFPGISSNDEMPADSSSLSPSDIYSDASANASAFLVYLNLTFLHHEHVPKSIIPPWRQTLRDLGSIYKLRINLLKNQFVPLSPTELSIKVFSPVCQQEDRISQSKEAALFKIRSNSFYLVVFICLEQMRDECV